MRKNLSWVLLISLLFGNLFYLSVPTQARAALDNSPLSDSISIQQSQTTPSFPDSIKFSLTVKLASDANIQKITLNYRLLGNPATLVHSTEQQQLSASTQVSTTLDTKRSYIPPGTHLSYYWEFTDKSGAVFDSPAQELVYQDKRFPFQELSQGVVTVRWYQGSDAFGKAALDKALATIDRLNREYNIKATNPINITIYPDTTAMFTALPPNTAEWVGGQAIPTLGTIVLAIPPGNMTEIGRSIPHEVTHQVNYQATINPYNYLPKWLDEGLAVYNQDGIDGFLSQAFQRGIDKQNLIPLRVLNGSFPADPQQSYMSYGESVNVIQYILKKYGNAGIGKIMASFKDGVSYDEAVKQGLGIGLDELDREWKESFGYPVDAPGQAGNTVVQAATGKNSSATVAIGGVKLQLPPETTVQLAGANNQAAASGTVNNSQSAAVTQTSTQNDDSLLLIIVMVVAGLVAIGAGIILVLTGRKPR